MSNTPNPRDPFEPPEDETLELRLQRLVDGELDDSASANLMEELEAEHDGWRKCALAFIEHQLWDQSLAPQGIVEPAANVDASSDSLYDRAVKRLDEPKRSTGFSTTQTLALAACLTLAFFLGRQLAPNGSAPGAPEIGGRIAESGPTQGEVDPRLRVVGEMELMPRGREVGQPHRLPVLAGSPEFNDRSSIPDSLYQQLRDAGYRVNRSTSFQTMPVGDEGVMFIPVEQVDLKAPRRFIP